MSKMVLLCLLLFMQTPIWGQEVKDCQQGARLLNQYGVEKNWDEADRLLKFCRQTFPHDAAVFANMARLAYQKTDLNMALAAYLRVWELSPRFAGLDQKILNHIFGKLEIERKNQSPLWDFGDSWADQALTLLLSWNDLASWRLILTMMLIFSAIGLGILFFRKKTAAKSTLSALIILSFIGFLLSFLLFRNPPLGYGVLLNSQAGLSSPSDLGSPIFELKEGAPVAIMNTMTVDAVDWVQIQAVDRQRAWMKRENFLSYSEF